MLEWLRSMLPGQAPVKEKKQEKIESLEGSYARLCEETRTIMKKDTQEARDVAKGVLDAMVRRHV